MKILLCEDDSNIATIARLALETVGKNQVTLVTDGEMAFNFAIKSEHDLILLDDMMPKMSGVDVCAKLAEHKAQNPKAKFAPVIFMSANPQDKQVALHSHIVVGYIPKPFDPMTLNQQISTLLTGWMGRAG